MAHSPMLHQDLQVSPLPRVQCLIQLVVAFIIAKGIINTSLLNRPQISSDLLAKYLILHKLIGRLHNPRLAVSFDRPFD